jgi:hypothetical protein
MRKYRVLILVAVIVVLALFTRNNAHAIGRRARPVLAAMQVVQSGASQLTILAPKPGQRIQNNAVTINYALQRTATAQSMPTFQLRLDAGDVIQTGDTNYTFTGLGPGNHTISVQAVDANGAPLPNTQGQVQFTILAPSSSLGLSEIGSSEASAMPEPHSDALSILGMVGFGVLVGGALGVYRTNHRAHEEPPRRRATDR